MLAEAAAAPGPLHYVLEGEGFQILGSASNEDELMRILSQSIEPDVIVVDAAVPAATVMIAHEFAPDSGLIVIWPEGTVPPATADQVFPDLVFEELGPAVRRAAERNRLRHPVDGGPSDVAADITSIESPTAEAPSAEAAARTAGRVLVGTVALIAAIVLTMGVSFALQGFHAAQRVTETRAPIMTTSAPTRTGGSSLGGSTHAGPHASDQGNRRCDANRRNGPNTRASSKGQEHAGTCPAQGGGGQGSAHQGGGANGSGSGQADGHGQGAGQGQGSAQEAGSGSGGQSTTAPSDHPTGPPETPSPGHANPGGAAAR